MFWNTIPCSVANYFTTKIYKKCHFFSHFQFVDATLRHLSQNSRWFDVKKSTSSYSIHHLSFREILMRICLPFCLGFDVLNLFSSIKTVSSWFPIGGVSTLSDMMMTCFESSALAQRSATATFLAMEKSLGWKTCKTQVNSCLCSLMKVLPLWSYLAQT